jgi:murein DD-endopeptidase MepM/ murein hydrolase activator NlpD
MNKTYSIFILPQQGTQLRRLVFSQRLICYSLLGIVIFLGFGGWLVGDYFGMEHRKKETMAQREKLSALQGQAKDIQTLLANWKGLHEKIQDALPRKHQSSPNGHPAIEEVEKVFATLQSELEQLIASIPSGRPVDGRVTSGVGMRSDPWTGKLVFHSGLDIPNPLGTPIHAPGDGVVESVGHSNGAGLTVVLNHGQGITTRYAHLSKAHVEKGDWVSRGQKLADVGNTGNSTSPHLHYEVRVNGVPIDPRNNLMR